MGQHAEAILKRLESRSAVCRVGRESLPTSAEVFRTLYEGVLTGVPVLHDQPAVAGAHAHRASDARPNRPAPRGANAALR